MERLAKEATPRASKLRERAAQFLDHHDKYAVGRQFRPRHAGRRGAVYLLRASMQRCCPSLSRRRSSSGLPRAAARSGLKAGRPMIQKAVNRRGRARAPGSLRTLAKGDSLRRHACKYRVRVPNYMARSRCWPIASTWCLTTKLGCLVSVNATRGSRRPFPARRGVTGSLSGRAPSTLPASPHIASDIGSWRRLVFA